GLAPDCRLGVVPGATAVLAVLWLGATVVSAVPSPSADPVRGRPGVVLEAPGVDSSSLLGVAPEAPGAELGCWLGVVPEAPGVALPRVLGEAALPASSRLDWPLAELD